MTREYTQPDRPRAQPIGREEKPEPDRDSFHNLKISGAKPNTHIYSDPADQLTHAKLAAKLLTPSKSKI